MYDDNTYLTFLEHCSQLALSRSRYISVGTSANGRCSTQMRPWNNNNNVLLTSKMFWKAEAIIMILFLSVSIAMCSTALAYLYFSTFIHV